MERYLELIILLSGFAIISIAASKIALAFQRYRLPIITGFLFTGIICGPFVLELIPIESIHRLNFINETALAFIAFAAGSELYFRELTSRIQSIKWNTIGQLSFSFAFGSLFVFFLSDFIPYMKEMSVASKIAASLLTGTVFVARSPASAIAVIKELRAKGPFTQTVMGVTVVKDFAVIILFSVCFSFAKSLDTGTKFDYLSILLPIIEIGLSFGIGYLLGKILELILKFHLRIELKSLILLFLGYGVYWFNHWIHHFSSLLDHEIRIEPLIVCIICSLYITNYTRHKPEFLNILEKTGPMVYAAFFTLTGASLNINTFIAIWFIAVFFFFIRLITIIGGSYFGGIMAKDPWKFIHLGWMPYITQAGVALGLSTLVANAFPTWGPQFATMVIAVIVINQVVGPPAFKYALTKLGENRNRATFKTDGIRDAIIFGYENQSVSLARQLLANGWKVQIATRKKRGTFDIPDDITVKHIPGVTLETMKQLGADKTEAIVCIMSDKRNLETVEIAYQNFGTPDIIVRLSDRKYYEKFIALGVRVVDPSTAMVSLMDHMVRSPQATSLLLGMEKGQDTRDLELQDPNLHGVTLRDLRLPSDILILSIHRNDQMIISHGFTRLRLGDVVTFVGSKESLDEMTVKFDHA
ncbi:monovalent cation:proton antiporter family protein [Reichenbachiella versicolor]|uniref:monovalent cation:proton antiporter family protein n=1 Tax=Reichenbachiella versicolor TaxID=1821036 RepID=UPI000D6DCA8A|nr:cation:proton antiporter [Reichenbachiella versicolor]